MEDKLQETHLVDFPPKTPASHAVAWELAQALQKDKVGKVGEVLTTFQVNLEAFLYEITAL